MMQWGKLVVVLVVLGGQQLSAASQDSVEAIEIELDSSAEFEQQRLGQDSLPPLQRPPQLLQFVEAEYPPSAVSEGIEGVVTLDLLISDSGSVDSVAVVGRLHPLLDSAAVAAARRFRFSPAIVDSQPVPVILQYAYRFRLDEVPVFKDTSVTFFGRLLERGTKKPIADAMVVVTFIDTVSDTTLGVSFSVYRQRLGTMPGQYLEEQRLVTLTDSTGRFSFYNLPACSIEVTAPLPGYEEFRQREKINRGEALEVTYYIRRISYNDYEIVAYGKIEEKEVSRRQLTIAEIKKIPGIGGDAVRVVQALPGVNRPAFGGGQIVVRGAPTWDSQFYLDGVEIPQLYHFGGGTSTYNSDALEKIEFYPGGWSSRYGGGVAGVIEITGRKPKTDRWQGYIDPNLNEGTILLEGPLGSRLSLLASARMNFSGFILKWLFDNVELNLPFTAQPFYWDYLLRADAEIARDNRAYLTLFGSGDKMNIFVPSMTVGSREVDQAINQARIRVFFYMALAGWDWKIGNAWTNALRYSFTYAPSSTSFFGIIKTESTPTIHHLRDQLTYEFSKQLRLHVGADVNVANENLVLIVPNAANVVVRDTTENWLLGVVGCYLNLEWKPWQHMQVISGLRYDYYPELDYRGTLIPEFWRYRSLPFDNTTPLAGEPSLRINGRYEFVKNHTIKAAVGTYSQTPQPAGQVIHPTWGDPHLPATKATHYVCGYEWRISDLLSLDIQGYLNRQWNIPRIASTGTDLMRSSDQLWLPDGQGRMRGLELMLRHEKSERFFGWLAYTLSHSERYDPVRREWYLYNQDETHHLQLLGSVSLRRDWDVGVRLRYVTGKPETPIDSVYLDENLQRYIAILGKRNSVRVDPFFQLDLRIDKKFVMERFLISAYLDLQNLSWLFYKSPEMYIYNYDYSERTTVSQFIIPAFGVRIEF